MSQIAAQVSSTGAVTIGGSLITAGHEGTGVFEVTYLTPFDTEPVVVVTVLADQGNASGVSLSGSNANGFVVTIKDMDGDLRDRGFNFIATSS